MEEVTNLDLDGVLEVINDFPIVPLKNRVMITVNVEDVTDELVLTSNSFSESQYVIAVGSFVKDLVPGQKVLLDLEKMVEYVVDDANPYEKLPKIKLDPYEVDGRMYAMVYDSLIKAIDNR